MFGVGYTGFVRFFFCVVLHLLCAYPCIGLWVGKQLPSCLCWPEFFLFGRCIAFRLAAQGIQDCVKVADPELTALGLRAWLMPCKHLSLALSQACCLQAATMRRLGDLYNRLQYNRHGPMPVRVRTCVRASDCAHIVDWAHACRARAALSIRAAHALDLMCLLCASCHWACVLRAATCTQLCLPAFHPVLSASSLLGMCCARCHLRVPMHARQSLCLLCTSMYHAYVFMVRTLMCAPAYAFVSQPICSTACMVC